MYSLGIDIGTGSIKAVAIDESGKIVFNDQLFYDVENPLPGYSEQDADIIWKQFAVCIKNSVGKLKNRPVIISLSSYMHGIMAVDEQCRPLTKIITWADNRSQEIAEELRSKTLGKKIYELTGAPIHAMTPLCKIIWWQRNMPGLIEKAHKLISIKEYIWYRLFGLFEIDYSTAGAMGLFNHQTKLWNKEALKLCSISKEKLSDVVSTFHIRNNIIKETAAALSISENCIFCIGSSDGCTAMVGGGATKKGDSAITIGTSGAVRVVNDHPIFEYPQMIFSYILENDKYVCGGPVNNGGNILKWLLNQFLQKQTTKEDYAMLFKSIESVPPGSEGLVFLPYLNGERAPLWNEKAKGIYYGIHNNHQRSHFLKAALEGVCFGLYSIVNQLETYISIKSINISGGFTQSPLWVQMMADIFGKPLSISRNDDASAYGAAIMGLKASKKINDYDDLQIIPHEFIQPNMDYHQIYKSSYLIFNQLNQHIRSMF